MTNKYPLIPMIFFIILFLNLPITNAQVFETITINVVDSDTGLPVNGASVFLQIPSSTDANYSYYDANYAAQLPIIVDRQTGMDGKITYTLEADEFGALTQANAEGYFTDFIIEVRIEKSDYMTFHEYQRFSVDGSDLSLRYALQSEGMVPNSGVLQIITIYVKDIDGNPINGAGVTSTSQPSGQTTLSGNTGSEGYVTFDDVKTGSYIFLASASGYKSSSESVSTSVGELFEKTMLLEEEPKGIPGFLNESLIIGLVLGTFLYRLRQQR